MRKLVVFRLMTEKETFLTHVKVETLQASVAEAYDRVFFADVTLSLMFGVL